MYIYMHIHPDIHTAIASIHVNNLTVYMQVYPLSFYIYCRQKLTPKIANTKSHQP